MNVTRESRSEEETERFAAELAAVVPPGTVIALEGDLGAGKTAFARGFARGLGITEPVTSPTFTILQSYEGGRLPLWHFDLYRLEDEGEMDEIGYEDCFYGEGVSLVEWASRMPDCLPCTLRFPVCRNVETMCENSASPAFRQRKAKHENTRN